MNPHSYAEVSSANLHKDSIILGPNQLNSAVSQFGGYFTVDTRGPGWLAPEASHNGWMENPGIYNAKLRSLADEPLPPPTSFATGCSMETASKESLAQRLHVPPGGPPPPAHMYTTASGHPPISQHGQQPLSQHGQQKNSHYSHAHTHFPESPPDSGSEPYSPPNENHTNNDNQQPFNVKGNMGINGLPQHLGYLGSSHPQGMKSHPNQTQAPHSNMSPPHTQTSPHSHQPPPPLHTLPQSNGQLHTNQAKGYPSYMCPEPPKLNHPAACPTACTTPMSMSMLGQPVSSAVAPPMAMLNPSHLLPSQPYTSMNNVTNHPPKKRKYSDSPNSTLTQGLLNGMGMGGITNGIKTEPSDNHTSYGVLGPETIDDDTYSQYDLPSDGSMFMDGSYQVIKWQAFQPTKWNSLCDENGKDLLAPIYRVDADKGFNYSTPDDAFVCQKKNHFQVTVHVGLNGNAKKVKLQDGTLKNIDNFHLHFWGVKVESQSQSIKVEQSQSDRSKKAFHPVKVDLVTEQVTKVTVGRLHFSETTSNNMRKKGKPNPDQRYFMLVVGLQAHCGEESHLVAAHCSERIIVRVCAIHASNPGQFENDVDVPWSKGRTSDSVVHAGRVGINTDSPDEALTVHGNLKVTGHVMQPSDRRAKTDISELDTREQLKNISQLKVYHYAYEEEFAEYAGLSEDECHDTGVLAQDVSQVLPDAVRETGDVILPNGGRIDNFLVVNKDRIYMENVGAVKELCKVTDKLENRIAEIEAMKKKLIKQRDSLRSTASSCKSACSSISRSSSIPPPTSKEKKSSSHHHHHHHRYHHRPNGSNPAEQEGVCNNRVIQITVIVLVLVMAFCLVAITTLYVLERQKNYASYTDVGPSNTPTNNSSNSTSSNNSSLSPTVVSGPGREFPPHAKPLMPPRCQRTNCTVVCCAMPPPNPPNTPQDDPPEDNPSPTKKSEERSRIPNDVLPPDKGPDYIIMTEQPPDAQQRFFPQMVDVKPLPDSPRQMNDQPMDDYPYNIAQSTDGASQPKVIVNDNSIIKSRTKRSAPSDLTADLIIRQINQSLISYCLDNNCTNLVGGNYTYHIPIASVFPEAFVTIDFQFLKKLANVSVQLCHEKEESACSSTGDGEAEIRATPSNGRAWDLPVGYYQNSLFNFRATHADMGNPCSSDIGDIDQDFTEYTLYFYRYCGN